MPSQPPVPPLLSPILYLLPCTSLTLLTSTLGATTNWLVLRFICAALKRIGYRTGGDTLDFREDHQHQRVVLVSWLRDGAWWRESGRKLGIDFQQVHLVDGLNSGLGLGAGGMDDVEKTILEAIGSKEGMDGGGSVVLVLDGLDFLLAATGCEVLGVLDMVGELREVGMFSSSLCLDLTGSNAVFAQLEAFLPTKQHVYSTIITTAADLPLLQSPTTPLEISHTSFVMSLAHQARAVISLRGLDTGVAKDVSGVLRVSKGAGESSAEEGDVEERECLYYAGSDGGVKVFERGA